MDARRALVTLVLVAGGCMSSPGGDTRQAPDANLCGNHVCDVTEDLASCPADCTCGNHVCDATETVASCPGDCKCGNGVCDSGESPASCPQDCHAAVCGNSMCEPGETVAGCPSDCAATLVTRNTSTLTVSALYVYGCATTIEGPNQLSAVIPSGFQLTLSGITPGCYRFHAVATNGEFWRSSANTTLTARMTSTWTLSN
jgi:hypothetical protein